MFSAQETGGLCGGQCQWRSDESYQRESPSGFNAFAENIGFEI